MAFESSALVSVIEMAAWPHSASMSRGESATMGAIGDELAVDDLRQLTLETAQRFARGLVLDELALIVVAPGARVHGLDARREVEGAG